MTAPEPAEMPPPSLNRIIKFGPHVVTQQVFHTTNYSFCLVNLKPLLPGHVLVSPLRSVPHLSDLSGAEVTDLFLTVQKVQKTLKRLYKSDAFNIALQDGVAAGQSVPHVHAHIIPRKFKDLDHLGGGDELYGLLEGEEGDVGRHLTLAERAERRRRSSSNAVEGEEDKEHERVQRERDEREKEREGREGKVYNRFPKQRDEDRRPRTMQIMREEAEWLRREMERDAETEGGLAQAQAQGGRGSAL